MKNTIRIALLAAAGYLAFSYMKRNRSLTASHRARPDQLARHPRVERYAYGSSSHQEFEPWRK